MARNTHGRKLRAYLNDHRHYDQVMFRRRMRRGTVDTSKLGWALATAAAVFAIFIGALLALASR
jgi:hypothetical protein